MAKEELVEMDGKVVEAFPDSRYRVELENGHSILAYLSGKMRKFRIRIVVGDKVRIQLSHYDLQKGRISLRHKE